MKTFKTIIAAILIFGSIIFLGIMASSCGTAWKGRVGAADYQMLKHHPKPSRLY